MTSIVGSTIFSSRSVALGLDARTAALMDSIYAIGFGLGLRFVVDLFSQHSLKTAGVLVGLWEGTVLLHFLQKMPRSFDPYVGFGVRMFVDFLVTESVARMLLVLLWTGLGMILADIAPSLWKETGMRRAWSRLRRELYLVFQTIPQVDVPIPFLYKQRIVRFSPSRTSSVVSAATSNSTPTTAATPTLASTAAAPTEPSTSRIARAATPAPPPAVSRSQPPPTPGIALRKRVPGHFARDSETETDVNSVAGRPRIPSTETQTESESGLTTDNDVLGTSRGSRYSLFVPRETDLRLTESDSDDTSSTTTETPDAGTLRDISEVDITTPTLRPTFLPLPTDSVEIPIIDDTLPKTPLPPPDQVPDIPDDTLDNLDESWEKVEKDDDNDKDSLIIPPPVPPKWSESLVSTVRVEKGKVVLEPVTKDEGGNDTPESTAKVETEQIVPEPVVKAKKVEKAMSEPPWADEFVVKKKEKGKGKAKSVLSSISAVDSFFKSNEANKAAATNLEGPPAPTSTPAATSQSPSPPAGGEGDTPATTAQTNTDTLIDLDNKSTAGTANRIDSRTPPPTFSQIYPEGAPLPPSAAPASTTAGAEADADASKFTTADATPTEPGPNPTDTAGSGDGANEDDSNNNNPTTTATNVDSAPALESETESDVNAKDSPIAKRLEGALSLLESIKSLGKELDEIRRQQDSAQLDGAEGAVLVEKKKQEAEEVEKKIAKLERKYLRRYSTSEDAEKDTSLDVSSFTLKPATDAIMGRILALLVSDATELEVKLAIGKANKSKKGYKANFTKTLKELNITAEDDSNQQFLRITLPDRPKFSSTPS